ncbi:MAG: hypothetical protein ACAI44_01125 [Candidatus Sericytochromatia bacterium]
MPQTGSSPGWDPGAYSQAGYVQNYDQQGYYEQGDRQDLFDPKSGSSNAKILLVRLTPELAEMVPETLVRQRQLFPISFVNNSLTIAMVHPQDLPAVDDVHLAVKKKLGKSVNIKTVLITEDEFYSFLNEHYYQVFEDNQSGSNDQSQQGYYQQDGQQSSYDVQDYEERPE